MVGCGGSDSDGGGDEEPSNSITYKPVDSTSRAKPGGTFKSVLSADVTTFDLLATTSFSASAQIGRYAYQRLFKYIPGKYPEPSEGEVEGDAIESYEYSGDRLTLTLKMRPNLKLDSRAPTNGRPLDAEDVVSAGTSSSA
jgi:ABC-type transport system substrate-binding protein